MSEIVLFVPITVAGIWLCAISIAGCNSSLQRIARALEWRNERD